MDNEATRRIRTTAETGEPILPPNDAFLRELLKLEAAIDALGTGIVDGDPQATQAAINDSALFMLEAISLFRRLEIGEHADARRIGTAWYAVRTHHRALLDRFQVAAARFRPSICIYTSNNIGSASHSPSMGLAPERWRPRPSKPPRRCQPQSLSCIWLRAYGAAHG